MMYLEDVLTICEGEALSGTLSVSQNKNPRDLDVSVQYSFSGKRSEASRTQHFRMRLLKIMTNLCCDPNGERRNHGSSLLSNLAVGERWFTKVNHLLNLATFLFSATYKCHLPTSRMWSS